MKKTKKNETKKKNKINTIGKKDALNGIATKRMKEEKKRMNSNRMNRQWN